MLQIKQRLKEELSVPLHTKFPHQYVELTYHIMKAGDPQFVNLNLVKDIWVYTNFDITFIKDLGATTTYGAEFNQIYDEVELLLAFLNYIHIRVNKIKDEAKAANKYILSFINDQDTKQQASDILNIDMYPTVLDRLRELSQSTIFEKYNEFIPIIKQVVDAWEARRTKF